MPPYMGASQGRGPQDPRDIGVDVSETPRYLSRPCATHQKLGGQS